YLQDGEIVYIATDEGDKSFFQPFYERYKVRFLSDYTHRAEVSEISLNSQGLLEQIIASHGRTFTGTWYSTFSAYILRLRGYLKLPRV
ncbi:unnamed protein product, partial [Choristocarpus tenellus]